MFIPLPQDNHLPANEWLWEQCLDLARGKRRVLRYQDKEIHAPHNGRGWRHWPAPRGTAWAVKQYNNLGGRWKKKDEKKASTIVIAGLGDTLEHAMTELLSNFSLEKTEKVGKWFQDNFRIQTPKTPRGMKDLKDKADKLRWWMVAGPSSYASNPAAVETSVRDTWNEIRPHIEELVTGFTDEGTVVVPKELRFGGTTYLNEVGLSEPQLKKYIARLETIFSSLKDWHRKALVGGVEVVLASPRNFHGTSGGKYKSGEDRLLVRTTPTILKRGGGYASFEYIIAHELGHRYEYKQRLSEDFDKPKWWTTNYSKNENESFAELFALSHFNLHGTWDQDVVDRFQNFMSGQGDG